MVPYTSPEETLRARAEAVARRWADDIRPYRAVATHDEDLERCRRWTARVIDLLTPPTLDERAGRQIGAALGRDVTFEADALQATTTALGAALLEGLPAPTSATLAPRLIAVLAAIGAGFLVAAQESQATQWEDARAALVVQRQQAAQALRASDERFRAVFENAGVGISITDLDGRLLDTNRTMQVAMAFSEGELRGRHFVDLIHPDDASDAWDRYQRLAASGAQHAEFDGRFVRKDGRIAWGHVTTSLIRDALGRPRYAVEISENITQRKQAEVALAAQHRATEAARGEARAILDSTNEAMALVAPDGRVCWVNERAATLFALDPDDTRDRQIGDFADYAGQVFGGRARAEAIVALVGDRERAFTTDIVQEWPTRRDLELHSRPVRDAEGAALGRLFSFRDVTHERAADRLKADFVSMVSHEIRTPLTSIRGYVDLLLQDEAGSLTAEQREFLTVVGNNSKRLQFLINDLLDISKLESGAVRLRRAAVDLTPLLAAIAASFRPLLAGKSQHLTVETLDPVPPVHGDPERVTQILANLVSNANKYTPVGGHIRITVERAVAFARISVRDTGAGIAAADLPHVFTRFYRAADHATQQATGAGLGLAITRSLVMLHGGEITVESDLGQGSTFRFTLPLAGA